jgi:hypothetical protein
MVSYADGHGDSWVLGDDVALPAGQTLSIHLDIDAEGAAAVASAWLITPDGDLPFSPRSPEQWALNLDSDHLPVWGYVAVQFDGAALGLCDDGDGTDEEWEWVSPAWFTSVDHDWDGDGLSYQNGDCDDEDASVQVCDTGGPDTGIDSGTDTSVDTSQDTSPVDTDDSETADSSPDTDAGLGDTGMAGRRCGCGAAPGTMGWVALLAGLAGVVRRRAR